MYSLLELQREMRTVLLTGDDMSLPPVIGGAASPNTRVRIYRNNVIGNLTGALRLSFPATERLVGADFFAAACAHFISAHPPTSADLYEYGATFPAFLDTFEPARRLPYLPNVARLEWAVNRALHTTLSPALTAEALRDIAEQQPAELRFVPHPSLSVLELAHPAKAIWEAVLTEDATTREHLLDAIDLKAPGDVLAVLYGADGLAVLSLSPVAFALARGLINGQTLADALALIPSEDAVAVLGNLIEYGFFARCELPNNRTEKHPG